MKEAKDSHLKTQAIAWRDGREKEQVVRLLNKSSVVRYQPAGIVGNTGKQVLWMAQKIAELADAGQLEDNPESHSLQEEITSLRHKVEDLEKRFVTASGGEVTFLETINLLIRQLHKTMRT